MKFSIVRIVLAAVAAATLAGCASDPRRAEGVQWVVAQQQERATLQAQGFPQYNLD